MDRQKKIDLQRQARLEAELKEAKEKQADELLELSKKVSVEVKHDYVLFIFIYLL